MRVADLIVIAVYLAGMVILGVTLSGRQRSSTDYFIGNRTLPWWAVCLSVVATETSTLTVISVPTTAYLGSFTFLQLAIGYLIGRVIVAFVLLPKYAAGHLVTAYSYLGQRFGDRLQGTASLTFLVTRLLADGVRLFATAIPLKIVLEAFGVSLAYWQIILVVAAVTVIYTYLGGIRAVVWVDVAQMLLYAGGAVLVIGVLTNSMPAGGFDAIAEAGKLQVFDFSADLLASPYAFVTAVVGGAVLSMASHGSDQLMVQRLLACRNLQESRKALIGSAVVVAVQFALFLGVGALLYGFYRGASPAELGLSAGDEIFPTFIVNQLPVGVSGLLIAAILGAAMSTLSSSLNSLSTSTVTDIYRRFLGRNPEDSHILRMARVWTLIWAGAFVVFASLFTGTDNPVVELGLGITGYTYGALLGAFLFGLLVKRASQTDALVAFLVTIGFMAWVVLGVTVTDATGESVPVAYPWYTPIGVVVTFVVGGLLSLRHRSPSATASEERTPADTST